MIEVPLPLASNYLSTVSLQASSDVRPSSSLNIGDIADTMRARYTNTDETPSTSSCQWRVLSCGVALLYRWHVLWISSLLVLTSTAEHGMSQHYLRTAPASRSFLRSRFSSARYGGRAEMLRMVQATRLVSTDPTCGCAYRTVDGYLDYLHASLPACATLCATC